MAWRKRAIALKLLWIHTPKRVKESSQIFPHEADMAYFLDWIGGSHFSPRFKVEETPTEKLGFDGCQVRIMRRIERL